jgi:hypothetical protein
MNQFRGCRGGTLFLSWKYPAMEKRADSISGISAVIHLLLSPGSYSTKEILTHYTI